MPTIFLGKRYTIAFPILYLAMYLLGIICASVIVASKVSTNLQPTIDICSKIFQKIAIQTEFEFLENYCAD